MSLLCSGISVQCMTKSHVNQDEFGFVRIIDSNGKEITIALVADGVSRCFEGRFASYNTVCWFIEWSQDYFLNHAFDIEETANQIQLQMEMYNHTLNEFSERNSEEDTCCTVSGMITDENQILLFNAGDSRVYEITQSGAVRCLTQDDVAEDGSISMHIGGKNDGEVQISFSVETFDSQNQYLICTDGLYTNLNFSEWHTALFSVTNREETMNLLLNMVDFLQDNGEMDDITGIILAKNNWAGQVEQNG